MKINITGVFVDDQRKAHKVYTDVLGFVTKHAIAMGEGDDAPMWLTVVSTDDPEGTELLLEPSDHPAVKPYREALIADGIPLAQFAVDDLHAEYERLRSHGIVFTQDPVEAGEVVMAVFDDTCGNLIQIVEHK